MAQQNVKIYSYTVDRRLSHNVVHSIAQGENGFIWIGTQNGLNRFDGYEIVQFENSGPDSIFSLSNNIRRIISYDKHSLFLGTDNGLYRFDLDNYSFKKIEINSKKHNNNPAQIVAQICKRNFGRVVHRLATTGITL